MTSLSPCVTQRMHNFGSGSHSQEPDNTPAQSWSAGLGGWAGVSLCLNPEGAGVQSLCDPLLAPMQLGTSQGVMEVAFGLRNMPYTLGRT